LLKRGGGAILHPPCPEGQSRGERSLQKSEAGGGVEGEGKENRYSTPISARSPAKERGKKKKVRSYREDGEDRHVVSFA